MEVSTLDYAIGEVLLMKAGSILVKISKWDREELWNPWQGNFGSY